MYPLLPGQGGGSEKKAQLVFARATSRKVTESQKKAQAAQLVYCESDSAWQETNRHRSRAVSTRNVHEGSKEHTRSTRNIQIRSLREEHYCTRIVGTYKRHKEISRRPQQGRISGVVLVEETGRDVVLYYASRDRS